MFCPSCQSEYRAGFTECNDCHVHLVGSRDEMWSASASRKGDHHELSVMRRVKTLATFVSWRDLGKSAALFTLHQYIATLGIDILAGFMTGYIFDVLHLFGRTFPQKTMFWILTGTPYYPVQIVLGLLVGWVVGRRVRHRAMLWVWVLPAAYLTYALIAIPTLVPHWIPPAYQAGVGESRFKHYFGWGCGDVHPCFDQNAITVLFYIAAAYSIGALLARKIPSRSRPTGQREFWSSLSTGLVFLFLAVLELVLTIRQGWRGIYLGLVTTPAGIGAFLLLYAFLQRNRIDSATGK
jgi:hypothetical protein